MQVDLERDYVMKIRLKFTKEGPVKYVGHLDTMRLFQRAIKVAEIPVAYSQGFSPHSLVYFALPLGVGVSSIGEYMEIITTEDISPELVMKRLNKVLVEGIRILSAWQVEDKGDSLMSLVCAADYDIKLLLDKEVVLDIDTLKQDLESAQELVIMKKGKKGIKPVDIKPLILNCNIVEREDGIHIQSKVLAGSSQNLNPELLVKALVEKYISNYEIQVTRKEMYTQGQDGYEPIDTFGNV